MIFKHATYHLSKILFIFAVVFCLCGCEKKPPLPPPTPPLSIEKPIRMNGKITGYAANPEGNIDRIMLNRGNQRFEIHFPPHLAKSILEIAKVNASVHLEIFQTNRGYELVSVSSENGRNNFATTEIAPPKPSPGKEVRLMGTISTMIRNRDHEITGFVIGKKTVMLNPEESKTLAPLLMKANRIEITALERNTKDGTVNTLRFPPVIMTEIKIDSIVYKIR